MHRRSRVALSTCIVTSLGFSLLAGCASRSTTSALPSVHNLPRSSATQNVALYQEAKQHFGQKDYAGALTRLDAIVASPDLTPQQLSYYQRQQQICRDRISGKNPATAPVVANKLSPAASADCGPRALLLICKQLQVAKPPTLDALRKIAGTGGEGTSLKGLEAAAKTLGLTATGVQMDQAALSQLADPAIAWVDGNHYIAVLDVHTSLAGVTSATVHDPNDGSQKQMPVEELLRHSGGVLLVLSKAPAKSAKVATL